MVSRTGGPRTGSAHLLKQRIALSRYLLELSHHLLELLFEIVGAATPIGISLVALTSVRFIRVLQAHEGG